MSATYSQLLTHAVFSVRDARSLILPPLKPILYKHIQGILSKKRHTLLIINGTEDHVHLLFRLNPFQSLSDLMQDIKGNSAYWVNHNSLIPGKFSWQKGYGSFSLGNTQIPEIYKIIEDQEKYHASKCFLEEYIELLIMSGVTYELRGLFKPVKTKGEPIAQNITLL